MSAEKSERQVEASPRLRHPREVADASVWVSRFMPQGNNHNRSVQWMAQFTAAGGLFVEPSFLLIEVSAGIARQVGRAIAGKYAVNYLTRIPALSFVPLDDDFIQKATELAADLHLRAGDAVYVTVAHILGIPLVSWDKEQIKRVPSGVLGYTPDEFLL